MFNFQTLITQKNHLCTSRRFEVKLSYALLMNLRTQNLTLSAMFMALGVLIPMLFHGVGLGSIFLPMFWPVAACGFFLPVSYAIAVGLLTLLTGMPPISPPILYIMMAELTTLAGTIGFFYQRTRWGTFWLLLTGMAVSRIVLYLFAGVLGPIFGLPPKLISIVSVVKGIPGIITMLILIPIVLKKIKHEVLFRSRKHYVQGT